MDKCDLCLWNQGSGGGGGGSSGFAALLAHVTNFYAETETFNGCLGEERYIIDDNGTMNYYCMHDCNVFPNEDTGEVYYVDEHSVGLPLFPAETGIKLFWLVPTDYAEILTITPSGGMATTPIELILNDGSWLGYELTGGVGYAEIVVNDESDDL